MHLQLNHRFPAAPDGIAPARRRLRSWLQDAGIGNDDASDLLLVFSELANNAVEAAVEVHAPDDGAQAIDLTGHYEAGRSVVLELTGPGACPDPTRMRPALPDDGAEGGRGLAIVAALSDHVESEHTGSETLVRATKALTSRPVDVLGQRQRR